MWNGRNASSFANRETGLSSQQSSYTAGLAFFFFFFKTSSVVIVSGTQQIEQTFVGQLLNYTTNYNVKWYSYVGKPFRVCRVIKTWSQKSCVWIFITALFVIGQNWKQPMCHHPGKQIVVYPYNRVLLSKKKESVNAKLCAVISRYIEGTQ